MHFGGVCFLLHRDGLEFWGKLLLHRNGLGFCGDFLLHRDGLGFGVLVVVGFFVT